MTTPTEVLEAMALLAAPLTNANALYEAKEKARAAIAKATAGETRNAEGAL